MNFIITNDCNKGCKYCFAAQNRKLTPKNERQMSYGQFLEYLDKLPADCGDPSIKLLGGEPTQHSDFERFAHAVIDHDRPLTIISNFLFDEDVRKQIIGLLQKKPQLINFLINATDLDVRNRMEKWKDNYMSIYSFLYKIDQENRVSIGFTLEHSKDWKYYVEYLDFVLDNVSLIERLRLSLPFPGNDNEKNNFDFINNKELGNKFLRISRHAINNNIKPTIDCIIYPCMFETKEHFKYMLKFFESVRTYCGESAPADIFPDGTVSFCYPLREIIKVDSRKYETLHEVADDLVMRYQTIESGITPPEPCQSCAFRESGECNGPCLGMYDLSGETVGRNV